MARSGREAEAVAEVMTLFEHVIESSKVGVRKTDPRITSTPANSGVPPEAFASISMTSASTSNRRAPLACERSRSAIRHRHRRIAGDRRHSPARLMASRRP